MTDVPACIACGRRDDQVPLLELAWRGARAFVRSQHLPVFIHDPARLAGRMDGAETLGPAEHGD
ncbi:MAG: hypothetical protein R6X22_06410 [Gemmatimonadota bacterium]